MLVFMEASKKEIKARENQHEIQDILSLDGFGNATTYIKKVAGFNIEVTIEENAAKLRLIDNANQIITFERKFDLAEEQVIEKLNDILNTCIKTAHLSEGSMASSSLLREQ